MFLLSLKIWFRRQAKNLPVFILSYSSYALGYILAVILFLYVYNQSIYNRSYPNHEFIYRIIKKDNSVNSKTPKNPYILSETIRQEVPNVLQVTSYCKIGGLYLEKDGNVFSEIGMRGVDADFFDIFSLRFLRGAFDDDSFSSPYNVVVTKSAALKYFNSLNVIDSLLQIERGAQQYNFNIIGVVEDFPENSTIRGSMFINIVPSFNYILKGFADEKNDWDNFYFETYARIPDYSPYVATEATNKVISSKLLEYQNYSYSFQKIKDIYLESEGFINDYTIGGDKKKVATLKLLIIFILIVITINFIIFNATSSVTRHKEIGLKKLAGATKKSFIKTAVIESIISACITIVLVIIPVLIIKPESSFKISESIIAAVIFLTVLFLVSLFSSAYQFIYQSDKGIINVITGSVINVGKRKNVYRKGVIFIQTSVFITIILYTLVVYKQTSYALNTNPGFNPQNLLIVRGDFLKRNYSKYTALKNEIKKLGSIESISGSVRLPPMREGGTFLLTRLEKYPDEKVNIEMLDVDFNFTSTLQIKITEGRGFSESLDNSQTGKCILTKSAVKALQLEDPLSSTLRSYYGHKIIGIINDIQVHSVHKEQLPAALVLSPQYINDIVVRLSPGYNKDIKSRIKNLYSSIYKSNDVSVSMYEDEIMEIYVGEIKWNKIIIYFAVFSVFIVSLGLIGLSFFILNSRTKEVGVRKVFGASFKETLWLLYKEFLLIAGLALLSAGPIAIYLSKKWLEYYPRHINIGVDILLITISITLIVMLLSISYKGLTIAKTNPVITLKYE
jgi:putative ABC transport system permease protein